jgi:hypothetical protein
MAEDLIVYRSRAPEVLEAHKAAREATRTYAKQTQAVLDAAGVGGYKVWLSTGHWDYGAFRGIDIPEGQEVPRGWRKAKDFAVPDKRTKAGRETGAALRAVKHPGDPMAQVPGMPLDILTPGGFQSPGVRVLEDGAALYVTWRRDPNEAQGSFSGKYEPVDTTLWGRVKLSEYYAAVEAAEAQRETAGAA